MSMFVTKVTSEEMAIMLAGEPTPEAVASVQRGVLLARELAEHGRVVVRLPTREHPMNTARCFEVVHATRRGSLQPSRNVWRG